MDKNLKSVNKKEKKMNKLNKKLNSLTGWRKLYVFPVFGACVLGILATLISLPFGNATASLIIGAITSPFFIGSILNFVSIYFFSSSMLIVSGKSSKMNCPFSELIFFVNNFNINCGIYFRFE